MPISFTSVRHPTFQSQNDHVYRMYATACITFCVEKTWSLALSYTISSHSHESVILPPRTAHSEEFKLDTFVKSDILK